LGTEVIQVPEARRFFGSRSKPTELECVREAAGAKSPSGDASPFASSANGVSGVALEPQGSKAQSGFKRI
jgi:hypothetical protein